MTALLLIVALLLPLVTLAKATSFLLLIVFGLVNLALIAVKRKQPYMENIHVYSIFIPLLGALLSFGSILFEVLTGEWFGIFF